MTPRHSNAKASLGKRVITFILLATMVGWGSGISVPLPNFKDTSVPFMCQDHACSCRNAGNCWNHCCCFSRGEKIAWAQKQNVAPPETFLAEVARETDTSSEFCGTKPAELQPNVLEALCSLRGFKSKPAKASSCSGGSCEVAAADPAEPPPFRPVSLSNDMRCHAIGNVTLVYCPVLELDLGNGELVVLNDEAMSNPGILRPDSFLAAPDPPPPRV
ncbi:hypothetical protein [Bremerella cremea]|uniref:hypothetical protein n=1 Tax=Bremerella cremea TaxID=1031537 RepID=UPI0031ED0D4B